jgi:serine protease Do
VTSGIVSALARTGVGVSDFQFFVQTDAAINPGNSGGPLVTMDGRIAGINTAIFSRSGGSIGIGFAIPSNMAAAVVQGAVSEGRVVRPWLGASGQALTPEIAASLELERPAGVLVNDVFSDGPAARAGLKVGDVIVAADGRPIDDPPGLQYRIGTRPVGGSIELSVLREGKAMTVTVELLPAPEDPPRNVTELEGTHPIAGAVVGNLSPAFAEELGINTLSTGVVIVKIMRGSPAHRMRLRPGDVLLSVNDAEVGTVADLQETLSAPRREWRIIVRRGSQRVNLVVRA